jgi:hypothetical protein
MRSVLIDDAPLDAMHNVSFEQQKFSQVSAILARHPGYEGGFTQWIPPIFSSVKEIRAALLRLCDSRHTVPKRRGLCWHNMTISLGAVSSLRLSRAALRSWFATLARILADFSISHSWVTS